MRDRLSDAQREKRERKRERRAARPTGAVRGATLGQLIGRDALVRFAGKTTSALIHEAEQLAHQVAAEHARSVSCDTCAATKACCWNMVVIPFHEAFPVADRLRREGRDTPALRAALATAADAMESHAPGDYRALRRPCVLQGPDQRCTVYAERPRECGAAFVFSAAEMCSDLDATAFETLRLPEELRDPLRKAAATVEQTLGLPRLQSLYAGALPRMVLLALEAWDRTDFASYLAEHVRAAAARVDAVRSEAPRSR